MWVTDTTINNNNKVNNKNHLGLTKLLQAREIKLIRIQQEFYIKMKIDTKN